MSEEYGGEDLAVEAGGGDGGSLFSGEQSTGEIVVKAPKGIDGEPLGDDIVLYNDDDEATGYDEPGSLEARLAEAESRAQEFDAARKAHYARFKAAERQMKLMEERFGPMIEEFEAFKRQKAEADRRAKLNEGLPEFAEDPDGYVNEKVKRELAAAEQERAEAFRQQRMAEVKALGDSFKLAIETEVESDPSFRRAFDALGRAAHATMVQNGIDPQTSMGPYLFGIMQEARAQGRDPLSPIREYAQKLQAYEQSLQQSQQPQPRQRPSTRAFASPPAASRTAPARTTAKDIANMSDEDFLRWRTLDPSAESAVLSAMTHDYE